MLIAIMKMSTFDLLGTKMRGQILANTQEMFKHVPLYIEL